MTHTAASFPHGSRPRLVPLCVIPSATPAHPASGPIHEAAESAALLADAWRLWNHTGQPGALHDVQRHLADLVLAACTAAYLIDPDATEGEPDPAA